MHTLSIKNVPAAVLKKLRQRAKENNRSLQGELLFIVNEASKEVPHSRPGAVLDRSRTGTKTVAQIAAEVRARYPQPDTSTPSGVDIIRAARDAR